jgi:hypothetical protein
MYDSEQLVDLSQRFWYIAYPEYYPAGGLSDVQVTADTIDSLYQKIKDNDVLKGSFDSIFDSIKREKISTNHDRIWED